MMTALEHRYQLDGYLAGHGAPALFSMPVGRLCDFTRWMFTRDAEDKDRVRFEVELFRPPPGWQPEAGAAQGPWAPEAETASLAALASALG